MADDAKSSEATTAAGAVPAESAAGVAAPVAEVSSAGSPVEAAASSAATPPGAPIGSSTATPTAATTASPMFPGYTRNLLNVKVPVSVTLAAKKQQLKQIVDLAPGTLIQFSKSCDDTLELCVGDQCIARGVAVKVGEKFGLRVNALTPPGERFQAVRPQG